MTKKILVNYTGGYCGNFICSLLSKALNIKDVMNAHEINNSYEFATAGDHSLLVKPFGKLFQIHEKVLKREDLKKISDLNIDQFYIQITKLYDILYEEDEEAFIYNIKQYYDYLMNQVTGEYYITSIHYAFQYKNLSIHDVFKDTTVLHLYATEKKYSRYFTLLLYYKTKNAPADQILQSTTLSAGGIYNDIIDPFLVPITNDSRSIPVDIGKIMFEKNFDHLTEIEERLSKDLGVKVTLDRQKLKDYADKNEAIIKEILGEDYKSQTDENQIKKCFEFIENKIRVIESIALNLDKPMSLL